MGRRRAFGRAGQGAGTARLDGLSRTPCESRERQPDIEADAPLPLTARLDAAQRQPRNRRQAPEGQRPRRQAQRRDFMRRGEKGARDGNVMTTPRSPTLAAKLMARLPIVQTTTVSTHGSSFSPRATMSSMPSARAAAVLAPRLFRPPARERTPQVSSESPASLWDGWARR
jgi:hypothetical protein